MNNSFEGLCVGPKSSKNDQIPYVLVESLGFFVFFSQVVGCCGFVGQVVGFFRICLSSRRAFLYVLVKSLFFVFVSQVVVFVYV